MIYENAMPHDISSNVDHIDRLFESAGPERAIRRLQIDFSRTELSTIFSNEASYTKN